MLSTSPTTRVPQTARPIPSATWPVSTSQAAAGPQTRGVPRAGIAARTGTNVAQKATPSIQTHTNSPTTRNNGRQSCREERSVVGGDLHERLIIKTKKATYNTI